MRGEREKERVAKGEGRGGLALGTYKGGAGLHSGLARAGLHSGLAFRTRGRMSLPRSLSLNP